MSEVLSAVVAGHLCIDIFPALGHLAPGQFGALFRPGRLVQVGAARFATGGPVSNTGLALHHLGVPVQLVAKVGDDPFGQIVRDQVAAHAPGLSAGIVAEPGAITSYSIIISPPGVDRIFLHCPGANDTFGTADIPYDLVERAALFHFGYPTAMRRMYQNGGAELGEIMRRAKQAGATTALDLSLPDPSSDSGRVDWRAILAGALAYVDLFLPSAEELLFTLRRETYDRLAGGGDLLASVTPELLSDISAELLALGVKIAAIKLGGRGLYVRTAGRAALERMGRGRPASCAAWAGAELWAPCFEVGVVGTTGAGDTTIAGFLAGLLRGMSLPDTTTIAVAVGACNVEAADALSGLRAWDATLTRIAAGWPRHLLELNAPGWRFDDRRGLWFGPA
jgi:sugar/nucleoside kinase (ribokinase family)